MCYAKYRAFSLGYFVFLLWYLLFELDWGNR